ncbi:MULTISPECIES: ArsR/SmtB family transcription factor [Brucella]|uniref:ArsR/SmtB family transcription factor n=1 Tax=Brucella TaxID=234 RepID=UPI0021665691|nr:MULTISPECIES: winged helix-turn-helix domain-containing protein [Brucella]MDL2201325.1 winged helix-turn-helix domain-containing protein [Brucella intermedia]UVV69175.1 winged helix-turn-helix domain-containing protein [Brucella anthropi]
MSDFSSISATAYLIADQTRAAMLMALMDERALPAGELARMSGVTAQTASSHLAKLLEGGLIAVETEGRHRYYRIADSHVAQTIEHIAAIRPAVTTRPKSLSPQHRHLRFCRRCYDHLAGQVGVEVTHAMLHRDYIRPSSDKQFIVTAAGAGWFDSIGVDVSSIRPTRRGLARQCLDWTERVHHLGGPLGVQFMATLCANGWLRRSRSSRAVAVTPKGSAELKRQLGVEITELK